MGRLESWEVRVGGWSGVGRDGVGFGGVQVRRLGSGRSEGLGKLRSKGWGSLGRGSGWNWGTRRVGALGSGGLGSGGLGLARKIGIREVGVGGELGSRGWGS